MNGNGSSCRIVPGAEIMKQAWWQGGEHWKEKPAGQKIDLQSHSIRLTIS